MYIGFPLPPFSPDEAGITQAHICARHATVAQSDVSFLLDPRLLRCSLNAAQAGFAICLWSLGANHRAG